VGLGLSTQVTGQVLALGQGIENGLLDTLSLIVQAHMSQHHDGREKEGSWVGKSLASNIRSGTVDSLEDGALVTNVTGWGKTKTTDETSAHIGENVSVKVRHDHDLVVVWSWVGGDLQAGVVQKLGVELDSWEVLGDLLGSVEEKTVGHLHDSSLVDSTDLQLANVLGVLEGETKNTLTGVPGDKLDALDDTVDNGVLDTRVFTLGVLTDEDSVDVVVWGLVTSDRSAWSDVGEEVESSAESQVERDVTLTNWGLNGQLLFLYSFEGLNSQQEDPSKQPCFSRCSQWSQMEWWSCHP
jgi:hypothetical protein